jgi:carbon storage regulator
MLVLSRKTEEAVVVGGADGRQPMLKVTVLDIRGGRVRLGFEADADLPVHRLEVWERIRADGRLDALVEDAAAPVA